MIPTPFNPLRHVICPSDTEKMPSWGDSLLKWRFYPASRVTNRVSQRIDLRGSLISWPLALRFFFLFFDSSAGEQ